jgi:hypothetical protein
VDFTLVKKTMRRKEVCAATNEPREGEVDMAKTERPEHHHYHHECWKNSCTPD